MKTTTTAAAELVLIPFPAVSHIFSMVELAEQLANHDQLLSLTVCVTQPPATNLNLTATNSRVRLLHIPAADPPPNSDPTQLLPSIVENSKPHIKEIVSHIIRRHDDSPSRLVGFVIDKFSSTMIDLANEFAVPSYIFYPSGANFLGFMLHLQELYDHKKLRDLGELKDTDSEMNIPSLKKPLPCKYLPSVVVEKEWLPLIFDNIRRSREVKGIIVNTFVELETYALDSLTNVVGIPPVYPVGPVLNVKPPVLDNEVMSWLDDQPTASVVFLCFGSMGSFGREQAAEIATALERSGHRFLWSLRRRPAEVGISVAPSEYENFDDVLPEGFLERTSGTGKVIGWAPQVAVLGHEAVGGFVSHCGWSSLLESMWFGVPVGAWPMYAEQQLNAFQWVEDLGLAEEIKMDYRWDGGKIVSAEEIEGGLRRLMMRPENNGDDERKKKRVKEMSEISRKTRVKGGSSYSAMTRLIQDMMDG